MARSTKRVYNNSLDAAGKARIVEQYAAGVATIPELAAQHGVSASSIKGWARLAGKTRTPGLKSAGGIGVTPTPPLPVLLLPTKKPTAAEIEEQITLANAAALATAGMLENMLREALVTVKADPGAGAGLIRAAAHASEVAERIMKMRRATLRMDRDNKNADVELPELPIRDLTDIEVTHIRRRQALEDQGIDPDEIEDRMTTREADQPPGDDVIEGEDDQEPIRATQAASMPASVPVEGGKLQPAGKPYLGWL